MFPLAVAVINLDRRPDRLMEFWQRWRRAAGEYPVTVHSAVDAGEAGSGPAACLASHVSVLSAYHEPVLVLEDDACFAPGFTLDIVPPPDWRVAWIGGQHRVPPIVVDDTWVRPRYLVRTHAYIARHPAELAAWLIASNAPRIDPYIAGLPIQQYALKTFTVGQTAGVSDIDGKVRNRDEYWNWPYDKYAQR